MSKLARAMAVLAVFGVALFVIAFSVLKVPLVAESTSSPEFCGNCHTMDPVVQTFEVSAHRDLDCNDCHTAHGFFSGPVTKMALGTKHALLFAAGVDPQPLRATEISRGLTRDNCLHCHGELLRGLHDADERPCSDCHRTTPHERRP